MRRGTVLPKGAEIVRRRELKGWTQEKLEGKAGCPVRTIQRAEAGMPVQLRNVAEIAQALGCELEDLLLGHDEPSSYESEAESAALKPGSAPFLPSLIIGRDHALRDLKARLISPGQDQESPPVQILTAVRGWPGVGKTTLAAALAHDPDIARSFPDGILWASLGPAPNLFSELAAWGRALGTDDLLRAQTLEEASRQLAALLRHKRMFLIVDDVWAAEHALPFRGGGRDCAMLITTRLTGVAQALAATPDHVYNLAVLNDDDGLELLRRLAPTVVAEYPESALELVRALEGLPLALQVAGRLINAEAHSGWSVSDLIRELRDETARLLETQAPANMADLLTQTTPTVAALFRKSTALLDPETRDRYAYLGVFAPKPATFDLAAMAAMWQVPDPKPTARSLIDRGLLEPVGSGRFQMHALLVAHARTLLSA